jgi:hypothetical protein
MPNTKLCRYSKESISYRNQVLPPTIKNLYNDKVFKPALPDYPLAPSYSVQELL